MLTVTRKRSRRRRSNGCSAIDAAAPGVDVRGRAHLERHPAVADERRQPAERHRPVVVDRDVVDDPDAVAQALGAAELERLPDRRQPERLAGVDRDVEVLAPDEVEGVEVPRRPVARLGAGDVEPDDARVPPADGTRGDLDRAGGLAHGRHQQLHRDRVPVERGLSRSAREPLEHRLDRLVERQPALRAQLGRHADLGIDHAVGREVLGALGCHAHDRVLLLHDADGVLERLEVELERLLVGAPVEPRRQLVDVLGRERVVPYSRARSTMVAGRSPPSRWSWRSALGAWRMVASLSMLVLPYAGGSTGRGLPYVGRAPWAPEAQRTAFAISRRIPGSK